MSILLSKKFKGGFELYDSISNNIVIRYSKLPISNNEIFAFVYDKVIYIEHGTLSLIIRGGVKIVGVDDW